MTQEKSTELPVAYWADLLRPYFKDRKVIIAGEYVAELSRAAHRVKELGASSVFMLGTLGKGAGKLPVTEDGGWIALGSPTLKTLVEGIHRSQEILKNLPQNAVEALDRFDPDHSAIVVGTFFHESPEVAGRKSFSYRRPEWLALEDKTVADELWQVADVPHAPSAVVPIDKELVMATVRNLDKGQGTVWSSDAKEGFQGGAEGTRWIRTQADIDEAMSFYQGFCDRIRIMPFLEGTPCSIHGIVFDDYVAALRPVEMVVLQQPGSSKFFYAGTSTFWDPNPKDREEMRDMAKRVGETLRNQVNYRGVFTLDGVVTDDGFRPTEINPRLGAGVIPLTSNLSQVPFQLLMGALSAGVQLDYRPQELEELLIRTADESRFGGTWRGIPDKLEAVDDKPLVLESGNWRWAKDGEVPDATVMAGANPMGGFARLTLDSKRIPIGQSVGPLARSFWQFVDDNMGGHVGPLEAAKSVR